MEAVTGPFIYFIRSGSDAVKIGIAMNPYDRLRALQVANHEHLKLLAFKPGGLKEEMRLHRRYRRSRIRGEWFRLTDAMRNLIQKTADQFGTPDERFLKRPPKPANSADLVLFAGMDVCPECDGKGCFGDERLGHDCDNCGGWGHLERLLVGVP